MYTRVLEYEHTRVVEYSSTRLILNTYTRVLEYMITRVIEYFILEYSNNTNSHNNINENLNVQYPECLIQFFLNIIIFHNLSFSYTKKFSENLI